MSKARLIGDLLTKIGAICDTGFALAVHIRYARPTLLYETYAREWSTYYSKNGLMLSDPIVHWGLRETGLLIWDEYDGPDEAGVLAAARAHGLHNGMTYSVGPAASRTISGLTCSAGPFDPEQIRFLTETIDRIHDETAEDRLSAEDLHLLRAIELPRVD